MSFSRIVCGTSAKTLKALFGEYKAFVCIHNSLARVQPYYFSEMGKTASVHDIASTASAIDANAMQMVNQPEDDRFIIHVVRICNANSLKQDNANGEVHVPHCSHIGNNSGTGLFFSRLTAIS